MPVTAKVGRPHRDHYEVAFTGTDLLVAPRAEVGLDRLVRLHPAHLDGIVVVDLVVTGQAWHRRAG